MTENKADDVTTAHVFLRLGLYGLGVGDWQPANQFLEQASTRFEHIADYRHWGECTVLRGHSLHDQGRYQEGLEAFQRMHSVAVKTSNVLHHAWACYGQAMCLLRLGQPLPEVIRLLNHSLALVEGLENQITKIICHGLLGLAYLRMGEPTRALDHADAGLALTQTLATGVAGLEGYAGIAETYLNLLEHGDRSLAAKASLACRTLRKFASVYSIGRARSLRCQGLDKWLEGKHSTAQRLWQQSREFAASLNMPYDEALACHELGRHLEASNPHQREYLNQAAEIFKLLGAHHP